MKWYKVYTSDLSAPVLLIKAATEAEALRKAREESRSYDLIEEYKAANKCEYFRREKIQTQRTTPQGMRHVIQKTVEYCKYCFHERTVHCTCKGIREKCIYPELRNK